MLDLEVAFRRCPDGVTIFEIDNPTTTEPAKIPVFQYRTERREVVRHRLAGLDDPLIVQLANIGDEADQSAQDAKLAAFLSQQGLLDQSSYFDVRYVRLIALWATAQVEEAGGKDRDGAIDRINSLLKGWELTVPDFWGRLSGKSLLPPQQQPMGLEVSLTRTLTVDRNTSQPEYGNPKFVLKPRSLLDFMFLEAAMIVVRGASTKRCDYCQKIFLTGSSTGRRSTSRFCRDLHRGYYYLQRSEAAQEAELKSSP